MRWAEMSKTFAHTLLYIFVDNIRNNNIVSCRYWLLLTCNFRKFPLELVKFPIAKLVYIS